jgi:hypothetical protein
MGGLSRAGQRNTGIEASWFSSVPACLSARRMLDTRKKEAGFAGTRLSCGGTVDDMLCYVTPTRRAAAWPEKFPRTRALSELAGMVWRGSGRMDSARVIATVRTELSRGGRGDYCVSGVFCSDHPLNGHSCFHCIREAFSRFSRAHLLLASSSCTCLHHACLIKNGAAPGGDQAAIAQVQHPSCLGMVAGAPGPSSKWPKASYRPIDSCQC